MEAVEGWFLVSVVNLGAVTEETNRIILDSRQALMLMAAILIICAIFVTAIWYTNRAIRRRDHESGYQAALINIFSTFLSRSSDNVFLLLDTETKKLVFYLSDRTRDRKAQDRLSEALEMAKAANEAKSAFLGSVSHDIRTPMNAIVGFVTLLKDEADNPAVVLEYAERIETASKHLLSLINDVLDINKIESGSTSLKPDENADVVRDALEAGMDAHIAKPVQVDTLKSTIQKVLDSRLEQAEEAE